MVIVVAPHSNVLRGPVVSFACGSQRCASPLDHLRKSLLAVEFDP